MLMTAIKIMLLISITLAGCLAALCVLGLVISGHVENTGEVLGRVGLFFKMFLGCLLAIFFFSVWEQALKEGDK